MPRLAVAAFGPRPAEKRPNLLFLCSDQHWKRLVGAWPAPAGVG